jgi:hypothetical protein
MINQIPTAEYIEAVSAGYRSGEAPPNGIEESPQWVCPADSRISLKVGLI